MAVSVVDIYLWMYLFYCIDIILLFFVLVVLPFVLSLTPSLLCCIVFRFVFGMTS
jgi:hypothetical protein